MWPEGLRRRGQGSVRRRGGRLGAAMRLNVLRMTWLTRADGARSLKFEGELVGPWVEEAAKACAQSAVLPGPLHLDLSAVGFVDAAGEQLLHELIRQGAAIAACSSFIAELLYLGHYEN
jgi:hypothetical protein